MKKLLMLVVAGTFSVSAAAYACDGNMKDSAAKASKGSTVAKKEAPKGAKGAGEAKPKS